MKKPYRNSIRSREMIRRAFIELLREKELDRITVVDIVGRADLSRNTFYAHYQDIYAILEEYQQDTLVQFDTILAETEAQQGFDDVEQLLHRIVQYIHENKEALQVLVNTKQTADFVQKLKTLVLERNFANLRRQNIGDEEGFRFFLEVLGSGFVDMIISVLKENNEERSLPDIADGISRIYRSGVAAYR